MIKKWQLDEAMIKKLKHTNEWAIKCPICDKPYVHGGWLQKHLTNNNNQIYKVFGNRLYKQKNIGEYC